jgi:hypothetical protein
MKPEQQKFHGGLPSETKKDLSSMDYAWNSRPSLAFWRGTGSIISVANKLI